MKQYYSINIISAKDNNISLKKWVICEDIHFRQAISDSGYCEDTRKSMADDHDLKIGSFKNLITELCNENLLKRDTKNHLKTTQKWHKIMGHKNMTVEENRGHKNMTVASQKYDGRGHKNMTVQPIRKNLERVSKSKAKKTFSFSLKKDTHFNQLTEEYKTKLFAKCLLLDNADNYTDFILALESNGKYKYLDFSKVYMKWYKVSGDNGRKIKIQDQDWIEIIHEGNPIAINPMTYEIKKGTVKNEIKQNANNTHKPSMKMISDLAKGMTV